MKMTVDQIKKFAIVGRGFSQEKYFCDIYFIMQITKLNGDKEMTYRRRQLESNGLDDPLKKDLESYILEEAEALRIQIDSGKIEIASGLDPDDSQRVESFKKIKLVKEVPEFYKDIMKPYYAD